MRSHFSRLSLITAVLVSCLSSPTLATAAPLPAPNRAAPRSTPSSAPHVAPLAFTLAPTVAVFSADDSVMATLDVSSVDRIDGVATFAPAFGVAAPDVHVWYRAAIAEPVSPSWTPPHTPCPASSTVMPMHQWIEGAALRFRVSSAVARYGPVSPPTFALRPPAQAARHGGR